jgi:hypothetical protein
VRIQQFFGGNFPSRKTRSSLCTRENLSESNVKAKKQNKEHQGNNKQQQKGSFFL